MGVTRRDVLIGGLVLVTACKSDSQPTPTPTPAPSPTPTPTTSPTPTPTPTPPPPPITRVNFSFASGLDGFTAETADYAPGMELGENGMKFVAERRRLPAPLDNRFGLLVGGTNRSDDLFMFIWREVTGLTPNQDYRVGVDVTIATNIGRNCVGVGGSPGESVVIKAGASPVRPAPTLVNGYYRVNFEKDRNPLPIGGDQVVTIGNFANSTAVCSGGTYELKALSSSNTRTGLVTSDSSGRLWLVIGTDSGFEARTEIYYLEGSATFTPV